MSATKQDTYTMIIALHTEYRDRLTAALLAANQAQRQMNQAHHEARRLAQHLARIEQFCNKNNITLEN